MDTRMHSKERIARLFQRLWQRSAFRKAISTAVVLTGLGALLVWGVHTYIGTLEANRRWVENVRVRQSSLLPGVVFQRLLDAQLVWVARDQRSVEIRYVSCENSMHRIDGDLPAGVDPRSLRDLFQLLCVAPQGEAIRQEIDHWNRSFLLLAVRDNRDINPLPRAAPLATKTALTKSAPTPPVAAAEKRVCRDSASTPVSRLVGAGCFPTTWQAEFVSGGVARATPAADGATVPYRDFAFVAIDGHMWAGDWFVTSLLHSSAAAATTGAVEPGEFYRLKTTLPLGAEDVGIDLIGRARRVRIDGREVRMADTRGPVETGRVATLSPYKLEYDFYCDENYQEESADSCQSLPKPEETIPFAFWFEVGGAGGRAPAAGQTVTVEIDAEPIRVFPTELIEKGSGIVRLRRTQHLDVACERNFNAPPPSAAAGDRRRESRCTLSWIEAEGVERTAARASYRVFERDGKTELVASDSGTILDSAVEVGLGPVVGLTPTDVGSLVAALDAMPRPERRDYRLTIDLAMQKATQTVVDRQAPCRGMKTARQLKKVLGADDCKDHHEKLRASVVLIDASDNPATRGEVLAIASWPGISPGLPAWSLAALEIGAPSRSPVSGMAWRAVDISATPGSSYKVITGLAAIETALGGNDEKLLRLLRGSLPAADAAKMLGLAQRTDGRVEATAKRSKGCVFVTPREPTSYNTLPIPNRAGTGYFCAGNASEGERTPYMNIYQAPCPGLAGAPASRGGLCDALIKSSNLFFGGLALYLDGGRVARQTGNRFEEIADPLPDLAMARASRRLFPDSFPAPRPPLGAAARNPSVPVRPALGFDLLRGQLDVTAPRLLVSPMVIRAATRQGEADARRVALGLSGYGQAVSASTLALANAYASVASGKVVRPRLFPRDPERPERVQDEFEGMPLLDRIPAGREKDAAELLQLLRRGLAGVITAGTGRSYFDKSVLVRPPGNEILFAKTGTATIGWACQSRSGGAAAADDTGSCTAGSIEKNIYSSWLAGWIEPSERINRRIAFACTVSYTFAFGGAACGPIMRSILEDLHGGRAGRP